MIAIAAGLFQVTDILYFFGFHLTQWIMPTTCFAKYQEPSLTIIITVE